MLHIFSGSHGPPNIIKSYSPLDAAKGNLVIFQIPPHKTTFGEK